MTANVPKNLTISEGSLTQFETDFRAFVVAERARIEDDKLFLTSLQVSNFQGVIDDAIAVVELKANSELDSLLSSL